MAPFTNYIIEHAGNPYGIKNMKISLVDVAGEHLEFARWRLQKKAPDIDFDFHEITSNYRIPQFNRDFDIICIMDVFEHLPNPYDVMVNLNNHSKDGAIMVETWINKSEKTANGPDLIEAYEQREQTMKFIKKHFNLIKNGAIRIRQKRANNG